MTNWVIVLPLSPEIAPFALPVTPGHYSLSDLIGANPGDKTCVRFTLHTPLVVELFARQQESGEWYFNERAHFLVEDLDFDDGGNEDAFVVDDAIITSFRGAPFSDWTTVEWVMGQIRRV